LWKVGGESPHRYPTKVLGPRCYSNCPQLLRALHAMGHVGVGGNSVAAVKDVKFAVPQKGFGTSRDAGLNWRANAQRAPDVVVFVGPTIGQHAHPALEALRSTGRSILPNIQGHVRLASPKD